MAKLFTRNFKVGEAFNPSPGYSTGRLPLREIGFPYEPGAFGQMNEASSLDINYDSGVLGSISLTIDVQFDNYITNSSNVLLDNNLTVQEQFIAGIPQPCLLDVDADGYVTRGDIQNIFFNNLGKSASEVADELGDSYASTLDLDGDGVVTEQDMQAAIEQFVGVEGCVVPNPLSDYPRYLDNHSENVAHAYSLRRVRSDYDGPCMSVTLDFDARGFNATGATQYFFKSLSNLGPSFGELPDPNGDFYLKVGDFTNFSGQPTTKTWMGETFTNVKDAWTYFKTIHPWLNDPLDIPFDENGYIDYSLIELLMEDPIAAYGIEYNENLTNNFNEFYSEYKWHALSSFGANVLFKDKVVVLIDRWYDQRADEQRDLVATVTKANEWKMHPFTKTSLMVGRFGKVMQKNGCMVIGSGTISGLGDRAHLAANKVNGLSVQEMLSDQYDLVDGNPSQNSLFHGIAGTNASYLNWSGIGPQSAGLAYNGTWVYTNGEEFSTLSGLYKPIGSAGLSQGEWPTVYEVKQYYNYPSETPLSYQGGSNPGFVGDTPIRFKKMTWQVGAAFLTQEQTNAEYANPHYEPDASLWDPLFTTELSNEGDPFLNFDNPPEPVGEGQLGGGIGRYWTQSNGKRTTFLADLHGQGSQGSSFPAFAYTGAHPGIQKAAQRISGYLDIGYPLYYQTDGAQVSHPFQEEGSYTPNYNTSTYVGNVLTVSSYPTDPLSVKFRSDEFGVVAQEGAYSADSYSVRDDKRVEDLNGNESSAIPTITSSWDWRQSYRVGNYRGSDLLSFQNIGGGSNEGPDAGLPETWTWETVDAANVRNPDVYGNMHEWISWNDKLPLQSCKDYLDESKTYFENKKIVQS